MLKKSFIRSLYVIPVLVAVILFSTFLWNPDYLITPPEYMGFEDHIERAIPIAIIAFYSLFLPNKFEIELGLVNGYGTLRLALTKVIPVFIYSMLASFAAVVVYRFKPFDILGAKSLIPIYVPEKYRLFTFFSVFVTLLFFSSVYFFIRVLLRNCYLPVIADLLIYSFFSPISSSIKRGVTDIRVSIIDPFITTYFVGNTIPNGIAEKYQDLAILKNAWTVNRLIFLFLSLVLLAATIMLLRREKLHRGFGD